MADFDMDERHLLTHAAAMGGWLGAGYVQGSFQDAAQSLIRDGLLEMGHKDGHHPCVQLTAAGAEVAAKMKQGDA